MGRFAIIVTSAHPDAAEFTKAAAAGLAVVIDDGEHEGQIVVLDVDKDREIIDLYAFPIEGLEKNNEVEDNVKGFVIETDT